MKRHHACSLALLVVLFSLYLAACKHPSPEARDAMTAAGTATETLPILHSSGAIMGMRRALSDSFPKVVDLMQQDSNARAAMLFKFWTGGMYDDLELCIYAYAFEQLGDKSSVFTLRQFIRRSIDGPFLWAPHFAAHAVLSITGTLDDATDTNWYTMNELLAIAGGSAPGALAANFKPAAVGASAVRKKSKSCTRNYLFLDANDQPIYLSDGKTPAVLGGTIQSCPELPQEDIDDYNARVANGGGTRISDGEFGSEPSRQFNCGGYALRTVNFYDGEYHKWNVDPTRSFKTLTDARLIRRVDNESSESYAAGDLVFYFSETGTTAEHVAEIHEPGTWLWTTTIWNADQISGMFACSATASYFDTAAGGLPNRKVYRWVAGQPHVIPDPDSEKPGSCRVTPVIDGECEEPAAPPNPFQRENKCPANGSLCQWCGGPETGTTWDIYAMIAWRTETKLDQIDYEATDSITGEYIDWNITFSGGEPANATLTVTHNKITGKGGSGWYRASSFDDEVAITSADISLSFSAWNMTGTIVAHLEDGSQATIEVKAAHCDGTYP